MFFFVLRVRVTVIWRVPVHSNPNRNHSHRRSLDVRIGRKYKKQSSQNQANPAGVILIRILSPCAKKFAWLVVKAIQRMPAPTNSSEVRSFMGMINYFNQFYPMLAHHAADLNRLLKKDV